MCGDVGGLAACGLSSTLAPALIAIGLGDVVELEAIGALQGHALEKLERRLEAEGIKFLPALLLIEGLRQQAAEKRQVVSGK